MITCIIFRCSVYRWIGIEVNMIDLQKELIKKKNKKDYNSGIKEKTSWYIRIMRNFLQGDSYSPIGFCTFGNSVCKLLQERTGFQISEPWNRNVRQTDNLLVQNLLAFQGSHKILKDFSEIIVQATRGTGACYVVVKCAAIVFEQGIVVTKKRLCKEVLHDIMKIRYIKFLGVEQTDRIKINKVFTRLNEEVTKRLILWIVLKLSKNWIK